MTLFFSAVFFVFVFFFSAVLGGATRCKVLGHGCGQLASDSVGTLRLQVDTVSPCPRELPSFQTDEHPA